VGNSRRIPPLGAMGARIVQADTGSDSDSESRRQLAVQAESGSASASGWRRPECALFISAGAYSGGRRRRIGADRLSQTVYRNDFLILVPTLGIGSRKLNLPAPYAHPIARRSRDTFVSS
jgi:hypothetical protein